MHQQVTLLSHDKEQATKPCLAGSYRLSRGSVSLSQTTKVPLRSACLLIDSVDDAIGQQTLIFGGLGPGIGCL